MATHVPDTASPIAQTRRWPLFLLGVLLFVLGPSLYIVQFRLAQLTMPWYVPILSTLGVLLMALSVWQRRGLVRSLGLGLCGLLCGMQWFLALIVFKTPDYTGPAQAGQHLPAFTTTLANGRAFTEKDLANGEKTMLLFFRGRW